MIDLYVDEAYAFDYISILDVKKTNSSKDMINFKIVCQKVKSQVGDIMFDAVMKSDIYAKLVQINLNIYNMIDLIRQEIAELDAKLVDDANIERYKLKKKLQDEFFMSDLTEIKTRI